MPRFFSGAGKMFRSSDKLSHIRKTKHKDPVSDETIRKLESTRVWKMENDFYEFAAAQFNEIKASFEGFQSGKTNFFKISSDITLEEWVVSIGYDA